MKKLLMSTALATMLFSSFGALNTSAASLTVTPSSQNIGGTSATAYWTANMSGSGTFNLSLRPTSTASYVTKYTGASTRVNVSHVYNLGTSNSATYSATFRLADANTFVTRNVSVNHTKVLP